MGKKKASPERRPIDLVHHVARRTGRGVALPAYVEVADGMFMRIQDVKADPSVRATFVEKLRTELQQLNDLRKEKTRLIAWVQNEDEAP